MKIELRAASNEATRTDVGIDWMTAVLHLNLDGAIQTSHMLPVLMERIRHAAPNLAAFVFANGELPAVTYGRRPYAYSLAPRQSVLILWHPQRSDVVIELGGRSCEDARSDAVEFAILGEVWKNLSRLDIAVDLYTTATPTEFVKAGYSQRIKSTGFMSSPTGETVYVGSRSSETYSRVYRYSPPHIRSNRLRVETVFRKTSARQIAEGILRTGNLLSAVSTVSSRFGWVHPTWVSNDAEPTQLHRLSSDASVGGKLRWIEKQVIPSLRLLVREGVITIERLIEMVTSTGRNTEDD